MIRMFYCHGYKYPGEGERDFFLAIKIPSENERLKHRDLTPQDIHHYSFLRYPSIRVIRFQEDPVLSMLAQKVYSELCGHQDETLTMDIIERLLNGGVAVALGTADIHPLADCVTA